jgi:iron complex transport system permease protein
MARSVALSTGLAALLAVTMYAAANVGPEPIAPRVVAMALVDLLPLVTVGTPGTAEIIVQRVRMPRVVLGAGVGVALGAAGTVMQGFFRNPMADPSIIGVSSGAATGAVAVIAFGVSVPYGLPGAAFVGGVVTAFGVYLLATEDGHTPTATLLLAGVAVQTFLGAVISYTMLQAGESLESAVLWLIGSLASTTWDETLVVVATVPPLVVVLFAFARDLNVLLLGEEDARALGLEVEWTKRVLLTVSALLTAAGVAMTGVIGFVGLVVPHVMRLLVGPDHRVLLPTSALAGGAFLVAADTLARSGPGELPVGIVTAAVGAPFFLYLLRTREVHSL